MSRKSKAKQQAKQEPIEATMSVFTYIILIGFAVFGIQHWLKNKSYIFEAEDIAKITKRYVGNGKYSMSLVCNTNGPNVTHKYTLARVQV